MNSNILRWRQIWIRMPGTLSRREQETPHILKGVEFSILFYWCNVVTPFGQEGQ